MAAAKAIAKQDRTELNTYRDQAEAALTAADAVMFSDEAIERAARAMLDAMYDDKTLRVDDGDRGIIRDVVAALKGEQ